MTKLTPAEIRGIAIARGVPESQIVPFIPCEDRNDDASACREGAAIRTVRAFYGVVKRRPAKKRQATSGCGANGRKFHGRLSALPSANATPDVKREPPVLLGGRTKSGKPFKGSIVCSGMTDKVIARMVAKREKMLQKIIDGK
jgi:hypothetical protein